MDIAVVHDEPVTFDFEDRAGRAGSHYRHDEGYE
jgi:hypothetical protein